MGDIHDKFCEKESYQTTFTTDMQAQKKGWRHFTAVKLKVTLRGCFHYFYTEHVLAIVIRKNISRYINTDIDS